MTPLVSQVAMAALILTIRLYDCSLVPYSITKMIVLFVNFIIYDTNEQIGLPMVSDFSTYGNLTLKIYLSIIFFYMSFPFLKEGGRKNDKFTQ